MLRVVCADKSLRIAEPGVGARAAQRVYALVSVRSVGEPSLERKQWSLSMGDYVPSPLTERASLSQRALTDQGEVGFHARHHIRVRALSGRARTKRSVSQGSN